MDCQIYYSLLCTSAFVNKINIKITTSTTINTTSITIADTVYVFAAAVSAGSDITTTNNVNNIIDIIGGTQCSLIQEYLFANNIFYY